MRSKHRRWRGRWSTVACGAFCASFVARNARADDVVAVAPPPLPALAAPAPPPCAPPATCGPVPAVLDRAQPGVAALDTNPNDSKLLHGFRIGYSYNMAYDQPLQALDNQSLKQKVGMRSPSHFLLGYEVFYRMLGHSWLNVILVANGNIAGLEQGKFYPSGNLLIGGEFYNSFQVGTGVHLEPLAGSEAHTIFAAGWTPRVGNFYVPLHAFFIPDVDGAHRIGMTTGVTW